MYVPKLITINEMMRTTACAKQDVGTDMIVSNFFLHVIIYPHDRKVSIFVLFFFNFFLKSLFYLRAPEQHCRICNNIVFFPCQKLNDCHRVQSAVAIDLDKIRWHLYVLDGGGYGINNCRSKIVVYDLKTYKRVRIINYKN